MSQVNIAFIILECCFTLQLHLQCEQKRGVLGVCQYSTLHAGHVLSPLLSHRHRHTTHTETHTPRCRINGNFFAAISLISIIKLIICFTFEKLRLYVTHKSTFYKERGKKCHNSTDHQFFCVTVQRILFNVKTISTTKLLPKITICTSPTLSHHCHNCIPKENKKSTHTQLQQRYSDTRVDVTESRYPNIMNTHIEGVHKAYIMRFVSLYP